MNKLMYLIPAAALVFGAAGAAAQEGDEEARVRAEAEREARDYQAREAEVQRKLAEAEARMAEAARQIAELSTERLPEMHRIEKRIELIAGGKPRLGVTIGADSDDGPVEGVAVVGVTPGSAASEAGLRAGDVITAVNDERLAADAAVAANEKLLDFMAGIEPGEVIEIEYLRDGKVGRVEVEPKPVGLHAFEFHGGPHGGHLADLPGLHVIPEVAGNLKNRFVLNWTSAGWGDMELVELNEGLGRYFGTDEGILVVRAPESDILKLEDGDVIQAIDGRKPTSVRHAMRILGSYAPGEKLTLDIMREKKRRKLEVEIPEDLQGSLLPGRPPVAPVHAVPPRRPLPPPERT